MAAIVLPWWLFFLVAIFLLLLLTRVRTNRMLWWMVLPRSRPQVVPSSGSHSSRLAVVGEPQRRNQKKIVSPPFDDGIRLDVAHAADRQACGCSRTMGSSERFGQKIQDNMTWTVADQHKSRGADTGAIRMDSCAECAKRFWIQLRTVV